MKTDNTLDLFTADAAEGNGPTLNIERACWARGYSVVAGIDEAGRGCLAGPVVAAAVILPIDLLIPEVGDSKQLSHLKRTRLAKIIRESAVALSTGLCDAAEIDKLNILQASLEAMRRAVHSLDIPPDFLLIDGNMSLPEIDIPQRAIIKGDATCHAIAAASIIAKTTRDEYMTRIHEEYSLFAWNTNRGYPTAAHYKALALHGVTPYHRRSFRLF